MTGQLKVFLHRKEKRERHNNEQGFIFTSILFINKYLVVPYQLHLLINLLINLVTHTHKGNKLLEITKILNKIGKVQKKKKV